MQKDNRITKAESAADSDMQPIVTTSASIEANPVLAAGNFRKLGLRQKHIVNQMAENDYYIIKTLDTRDMSTTILLIDEWHNHDRDLSESELQALWKRGILLNADVSMCLELVQEKFWLNEAFSEEALNACC